MEVWKDIEGYEEYYQISNFGNVRSKDRNKSTGKGFYKLKGKELSKTKTSTGYFKIELIDKSGVRKSYKVHRLVGFAFIPNPENKPNINHIDGNPLNNHFSNLEWCTQSENTIHAYETGLRKSNLHKYKNQIIDEYTSRKVSVRELGLKYNCPIASISRMFKKQGIKIKPYRDKYGIDRKVLIEDFEKGLSNKLIAEKHNTNRHLIGVYKYKFKNGELKI